MTNCGENQTTGVLELYTEYIMSFFKEKSPEVRCGAIIDVGSGSVGIAVVVSESLTGKLDIVWSHREHMLIKDIQGNHDLLKEINTTIINALLELGSKGLKTLHEFNPHLKIEYIQSTISAPWSYTVTKMINFEDEHPFDVTKELIDQLVDTAKKQTLATVLDGKVMEDLGLRMITDETVNIELNGYTVKKPIGNNSRSLSLAHISALTQEKLLLTIEELQEKILPKAEVEHYSFMYLFYQVLKYLHPDTSEVCLIDVTNEATEIGIVRDNILRQATYTPFGLYSLAREIAVVCNIPKEEAYAMLKEGTEITKSAYGKEKREEIQKIFDVYEDKVSEIFKNTGDSLSIPKTLFLHTSQNTEAFFLEHLKKAAQKATGSTHTVHLVTSELLHDKQMNDSALALSAHYFHTKELYSVV